MTHILTPRTPRPVAVASLLLALTLGLLLTGCGSEGTGDKGYVAGDGVITRLAVKDRTAAGEVTGTTLEGKALDLASYKGRVVVLNVWGAWCPPCRKEAPLLGEAARALAKKGVAFVGINTRDASTSQGLAFQRRYDVDYPSLFDPSGRSLLAFRGTLTPSSIPSTLIIDKQGRVAASILGEVPGKATLEDLVDDVVSES